MDGFEMAQAALAAEIEPSGNGRVFFRLYIACGDRTLNRRLSPSTRNARAIENRGPGTHLFPERPPLEHGRRPIFLDLSWRSAFARDCGRHEAARGTDLPV